MSAVSMITDLLREILQAVKTTGAATEVRLSDKPFLSIEEAIAYTPFGRTTIYEAMNRGEFEAHVYGNRTLIERESLVKWLYRLPAWEPRGSK